jgi:hypothetical protein
VTRAALYIKQGSDIRTIPLILGGEVITFEINSAGNDQQHFKVDNLELKPAQFHYGIGREVIQRTAVGEKKMSLMFFLTPALEKPLRTFKYTVL